METIRDETEIDRTEAAMTRTYGSQFPLPRGDVQIEMEAATAGSPVGQRLLVVLVNVLARMKGVVQNISVVGAEDRTILHQMPITGSTLSDGLERLVSSLRHPRSLYQPTITFEHSSHPTVEIRIGSDPGSDITVAADGWRAFLGRDTGDADWGATTPYGPAIAACFCAAEAFKRLLAANGHEHTGLNPANDLSFSTFNYGVGTSAQPGPEATPFDLTGTAVVGCGAGATAMLYTLAMQEGVRGELALIEPGRHKLSNLNRYLTTTASDVYEHRHKLASVANHLTTFAPALTLKLLPHSWELLEDRPWGLLVSAVDTVEARWSIQSRAPMAEILDGSVLDLMYSIVRVVPGGWCLECKHPYDPRLQTKQRAARWGQSVDVIEVWERDDVFVSEEMIQRLARVQNRPSQAFLDLVGRPFSRVPELTECGETSLRTDVPSQAPVLPLATTPAGVLLAAEIAKRATTPDAQLQNWIAHDLGRSPHGPRVKFRPPSSSCPRHT